MLKRFVKDFVVFYKRNRLLRMKLAFVMLAFIFLGMYAREFFGPISSSLEDWARFGSYLAGTVGVAALIFTLDALTETLKQQDKLLSQQEEQISLSERHNKRVAAYTRAEKIVPLLVEDRRRALEKYAMAIEAGDCVVVFNGLVKHRDLLTKNEEVEKLLGIENDTKLSLVSTRVHVSNYKLMCFMRECILDADELRDYFYSIVGEDHFIFTTALAFSRALIGEEDFLSMCRVFKLPASLVLDGKVETVWEKVGRRLKESEVSINFGDPL